MPGSGWESIGFGSFFPMSWPSTMKSTVPGWSRSCGAMIDAIRRHLLGRELEIECAGTAVSLTMVKLDAHPNSRALSLGQLGDVAIAARDVTFGTVRLPSVAATLRNTHIQAGSPTGLVAAPVDLLIEVPNDTLAQLVRTVTDQLTAEVDENGVGRLAWTRCIRLGHLEVEPEIVGTTLTLRPRHLVALGRRWSLPRWVPRYSAAMPIFNGVLVKSLALQPGSILLSATAPEWKHDLPRARWEDIVAQLSPSNK
jgi:hypothetical protein